MDIRAKKGKNKRKPSANTAHFAHSDHRKKRRRSTFSSETTIRTSSEPQKLAVSYRFKPIRSPPRASRNHEKRRSSQTDGHRRWVYSARDCSRFVGNDFLSVLWNFSESVPVYFRINWLVYLPIVSWVPSLYFPWLKAVMPKCSRVECGRGPHVPCSLLKPIYPSTIKCWDSFMPWVLYLSDSWDLKVLDQYLTFYSICQSLRYAVWYFGLRVPSYHMCNSHGPISMEYDGENIYSVQWKWRKIWRSRAEEFFSLYLHPCKVSLYPFPIHISIQVHALFSSSYFVEINDNLIDNSKMRYCEHLIGRIRVFLVLPAFDVLQSW